MAKNTTIGGSAAIGIDVSDKHSQICVLDETGEIVEETRLPTTPRAFERRFRGRERARIAIEVGLHSPWMSRRLEEWGHEVIVANARKLRLIYENDSKSDRVDAEYLARLARVDPKLLSPIEHRGEHSQVVRATLRARDALVRSRGLMINTIRGMVKSLGGRLPKCSVESFPTQAAPNVPKALSAAVIPLLDTIKRLNQKVAAYDKLLERTAKKDHPETELLRQVPGVGPLTSLAYVVTIEDPHRFRRSRAIGSYVGLRPRKFESGESDPQRRITKAGDKVLRRLLVQSAHYILGPFGPDTDLRRWGLTLAERGGKNAKKRAVIAVARKLAVLLHRLWITGEVYEPLRNSNRNARSNAA